jgi:hypothetical protein
MTRSQFRWSTLALCGWLLLSSLGGSAQAFQADREADRRRAREEERQAAQRERIAAMEAEREALQREIEELRSILEEREHQVRDAHERAEAEAAHAEAAAREAREHAEREYAERLNERETELRARHRAEREELEAATRESMRASVEAVNAEMIEVARALRSVDQSFSIRGIEGRHARTGGSVYVDRHAAELRGEEPAEAVLPEPLVLSGAACKTTHATEECVEEEETLLIEEEESTIKQEVLDVPQDEQNDIPPVPTIEVESAVEPEPTEIKESITVRLRATTSEAPAAHPCVDAAPAVCDPCLTHDHCGTGCDCFGQAPPGAILVNGVYVEATGCNVCAGGYSFAACGCGAASASFGIGGGCYAGATTFNEGQSAEYYLRGHYIGGGGARYSFYPAGFSSSSVPACEDCE